MRLKVYMAACFFLICMSRAAANLPPGCDCNDDEYIHPACALSECPFEDTLPDGVTPCCVYDPNRVPINKNGIWIISLGFVLGVSYLFIRKRRVISS